MMIKIKDIPILLRKYPAMYAVKLLDLIFRRIVFVHKVLFNA